MYIAQYCLHTAISKVYPDSSGTRLVLIDEKGDAYLHNPVSWMYTYMYFHFMYMYLSTAFSLSIYSIRDSMLGCHRHAHYL